MGDALNNTFVFLIKTIFEFYIMIVIMRLLLSYFRANFYNPLSQLVIKLTGPLVKPLQRFMPGFKGVDLAVVVLIILLEMIKLFAIAAAGMHTFPNPLGLLFWAVTESLDQFLSLYIFAVIGRIVLSWISAPNLAPVQEILYLITEPIMAPARRLIPAVSGFDLSPLVILLAIQVTSILILGPLTRLAIAASFS